MRKGVLIAASLTTLALAGSVAILRPFQKTPRGMLNYEGQWLNPAAKPIALGAKTTSLCAVGNDYVAVRTHGGVALFDAETGGLIRKFSVPGGAGLTGIVSNGTTIWVSGSGDTVTEVSVKGKVLRTLKLPKPAIGGDPYPAGMCLRGNEELYVCSNRGNEVVAFRLSDGEIIKRYPMPPAPYAVALTTHDGAPALVATCWSRAPRPGEKTSKSSGTEVPTTVSGTGTQGAIRIFSLDRAWSDDRLSGLQPTEIISPEYEKRVYTVSNSDEIVMDTEDTGHKVVKLPQMSIPNSISFDPQAKKYYVACMGSNTIRVYDEKVSYLGSVPTSGSPTGVLAKNGKLWVCTSKGLGPQVTPRKAYSSYNFSGDVMVLPIPTLAQLKSNERNQPGVIASPKELPFKKGAIEHVVFILKENRTYDQVFGDLAQASGDPKLCQFGRKVTPNHHALAEEFALLDNYYCNGVLSADGHSWAMEGTATTYLERGFGGWTRSYPYGGDDALAVSYTGYIWHPIVKAGKTFRNFGEFDTAMTPKGTTWKQVYDDFTSGANKIKITHDWGTSDIAKYSDPNAPGWNMDIPDVLRASVFLKAFRGYEASGKMPNFTIIYLPQDHTVGMSKNNPHPEAMVADNDLALGQIVEAVSKSKFWGKTAIFVNEDDPQNGTDHVDGHRSLCLVISPFTKRGAVVSDFYNQNSVSRTMLAMLGLPPLHARMAQAPLMSNCFTVKPDLRPYTLRPNEIPLDRMVAVTPDTQPWVLASTRLKLAKPDQSDEHLLNRIIWAATKGSQPFPVAMEGPHGRGLAARGLRLDAEVEEDEDGD